MALWAGSWVSGKLLSNGALHFQFIFWRLVITSFSYLIIHRISIRKNSNYQGLNRVLKKPALAGLIILSAAALIGYNTMFILGLTSGLAGKGGVIVTTLNPLIGFILGTVFYRNKFPLKSWLGIIPGLIGGMILVEPWKYSLAQLIDGGNLIFVAAAAFWALITFLAHKIQKDVSLWEFNLLTYAAAVLLIIPMIWNKDIFNWQQYSAGFWINTLYTITPGRNLCRQRLFLCLQSYWIRKNGFIYFYRTCNGTSVQLPFFKRNSSDCNNNRRNSGFR